MGYANLNSQRIYFEDSGGDGPPVILAHGFLMDSEMFVPQVEALRPAYRVITWDGRGCGRTEFDGRPFSYWDAASDCLGLLDHLGIDRAVVGGMSQGGFLSLRAALTAPRRVRALVLLDTSSGVEDETTLAAYQQMLDTWVTTGPNDNLTEIIAGLIIGEPLENARWTAKWLARPNELLAEPGATLLGRDDVTARLGEITCPALVVHGTADLAIAPDQAEQLIRGLGGPTTLVLVEGAGHAANLTHPSPVNEALLAFLSALPD